ncbi:MAG: helix-turn-helix domain-containing protein [Bacteroides sp.]|nr:helix-turn-helix domain-containing protein [Prevotella sp.]MCM1407212.1 helix-turn-helix domain-containing protein [Treponema brennaborense]MCM1470364.1 helix-turn-helix domain-containing protein [Bacteroides sp.]
MQSKEIQNRLGENLKCIRKLHKLTQFALAERANVSEDTIKSIELSRFWPSEKTLAQISEALEIDVYHLFLPTPSTVPSDKTVMEKIRAAISQSYVEYVESALKALGKK